MYYDCTTAFEVQDSSGKKYMSTAAHCPNNFEEKATGLKYSFVKEIPYTQGHDLQWNSTTATITNQFRDSPTTVRTLTGKRLLKSTNIGDTVCHYGNSTGFSCGKVSAVGTSIGSVAPNLASLYPCQFWVRVNTPTCKQGDSGGPAFTASTIASGIVSLAIEEDHDDNNPSNDTCLGYLYLPTNKTTEQGLSFVY